MSNIIDFIDLGQQPLANGFISNEEEIKNEYFYNLRTTIDLETMLVSIAELPDKEKLFNKDYVYRSSGSKTMVKHFEDFAMWLKDKFSEFNILEIGSNDGVFIKNFDITKAVCVEPCANFAQVTKDIGYKTYNSFWNLKLAEEILETYKPFNIIYGANCMCHIKDLDETFKAVAKVLDNDGLFIFEDPSLAKIIQLGSYDQIYDEHAHVFSVQAIDKILMRNGLYIMAVKSLDTHGGSNRIIARKSGDIYRAKSFEKHLWFEEQMGLNKLETYKIFAERVHNSKIDLRDMLINIHDMKKKIVSYGATSKSSVIFNYCNIGPELIDFIIDNTPEKIGKVSPGKHIPIVTDVDLVDRKIDYVFLGAWNFRKEIQEKETNYKGRWISHIPFPRII